MKRIPIVLSGVGQVGTAYFHNACNISLYNNHRKIFGSGVHSLAVTHAYNSDDRIYYRTDKFTRPSSELALDVYAVQLWLSIKTGTEFSWLNDDNDLTIDTVMINIG